VQKGDGPKNNKKPTVGRDRGGKIKELEGEPSRELKERVKKVPPGNQKKYKQLGESGKPATRKSKACNTPDSKKQPGGKESE